MTKAAVIPLAGTETHADLGRATNALETVKQFQDAGDELELVFDGAGVEWVPALVDEDLHPKFVEVRGFKPNLKAHRRAVSRPCVGSSPTRDRRSGSTRCSTNPSTASSTRATTPTSARSR
jgi:hypothetical protein